MIYIQHTCHKRDTFVNGHSSRRRDLQHYSPFTLWSLQKKLAIIEKTPLPHIYRKHTCHGGVGIQKHNYEKATKHHSFRT